MNLFQRCLEFLFLQEGGFSDRPDDPGGKTNLGISSASHPGEDITNMTRERAAEIYSRDYWRPCRCDLLPPPVALVVFDFAVNSGPDDAIRALQTALRKTVDGILGPQTLAAAERADPLLLARDVLALRIIHQTGAPTWPVHRLGWSRRNLDCYAFALELAKERP